MGRRPRGGGTIWIGIDDTDSPRGGCTTWVLTELLRLGREEGVDLLGEPRLVRLNPNIPWKTRGNAALAARFGHGRGPRRKVGEVAGRTVWSYAEGGPLSEAEGRRFRAAAWARVLAGSRTGERGTDPALVAIDHRLPAEGYWRAVREVVAVGDVRRLLDEHGAWYRTRGSRRGLIGAAAAIAWPGRRVTWELIAYRTAERVGRQRSVDAASVRAAARHYASLFLCDDPRTRRLLVAPHTDCPILFGLRSTRRSPLPAARERIRSEPVDRWVVFRTNQASGDHLVDRAWAETSPFSSARFRATVRDWPTAGAGGHVRIPLFDPLGRPVDAIAFEPTKTLPRVVASLIPGDRALVWGSRGTDPVLRLEGIRLVRLLPRYARTRPPRCPDCGRSTSSLGRGRGFRCPGCRRRFPPEAATRAAIPPRFPLGEYHPTPSARRHLALRAPESAETRATESF